MLGFRTYIPGMAKGQSGLLSAVPLITCTSQDQTRQTDRGRYQLTVLRLARALSLSLSLQRRTWYLNATSTGCHYRRRRRVRTSWLPLDLNSSENYLANIISWYTLLVQQLYHMEEYSMRRLSDLSAVLETEGSLGGTALLIVDPQVDFHEGGSLAVPGAGDDAERIAHFIADRCNDIDELVVTLDSHHVSHDI